MLEDTAYAEICRKFFKEHNVYRYRTKKIDDMSDDECCSKCHWYCEENGLTDEFWEYSRKTEPKMNREEFENYLEETYNTVRDYPWGKFPSYSVFRHENNVCFAMVLNVKKEKLGLEGDGFVDIVNLKCDPLMSGSYLFKDNIFPAYHMNKEHWISVVLGDKVTDSEIKMLVKMSYELTLPKSKRK